MTKEIYVDGEAIVIQVVTLNCGGLIPNNYQGLVPLFLNHKNVKAMPELIVVGLQEMVSLSMGKSIGNFFSKKKNVDNEETRATKWQKLLTDAMNTACEENYIFDS
jgi:ascorbate-specific PTS system EIIC-type component UlaA